MEELWKPIPGYESLYEASTLGRVRSLFRYKKILKPSPVTTGYLTVELWKDKKRKRIGIHRLVAMCFCENPENKPFVNHIDETRTNNRADNLEWVTHVENCNYGTAIQRRLAHTDYASRNRSWQTREHYDRVSTALSKKPLICVETGRIYRNSREASEDTGYSSRTISRWVREGRSMPGKLTFRKYEGRDDLSQKYLA